MADQAMKELETKSGAVFLTENIRTLGYTKPQAETLLSMALEYTRGGLRPDQWNMMKAQRIDFNDVEVLRNTLLTNGLKNMSQLQGNIRGRMEDEKQLDADVRNAWGAASPEMSGPVPRKGPAQEIPGETVVQPQPVAQKRKSAVSQEDQAALGRIDQESTEALSGTKRKGITTIMPEETIQPRRTHVAKAPSIRMAQAETKETKPGEPRMAMTPFAKEKPRREEEEKAPEQRGEVRELKVARWEASAGAETKVKGPKGSYETEAQYKEAAEAMLKFGTKSSALPPGETREQMYEIRVYAKEGPNKEYIGTLRIPASELTDILRKREHQDIMLPGSLTKKEDDRIYAINKGLILDRGLYPPNILNSQPSGAGGKTLAQLLDMPTVTFTFVAMK